jgi:NADPH-dependent 2,4-dienoyl-CoA reductase/sulfur reductase-like enzyme
VSAAVTPGSVGAARASARHAICVIGADPAFRVIPSHPRARDIRQRHMEASRRPGPVRSRPHRVAIVGAGFGGLFAAKALRRDDVEVTVVDRTNHHLFQPLLYQLATGILAQGDIALPIRDILRRRDNVSVLLGDVMAIDFDARRLTVDTLGLPSDVPMTA